MFCSTYFGNNLAGKLQERNSVWHAGFWSRAKWSKHCLGPQHQLYCKFLSFLFSCVGFWPRNWTMLSLWGHRRRKISSTNVQNNPRIISCLTYINVEIANKKLTLATWTNFFNGMYWSRYFVKKSIFFWTFSIWICKKFYYGKPFTLGQTSIWGKFMVQRASEMQIGDEIGSGKNYFQSFKLHPPLIWIWNPRNLLGIYN